MQATFATSSTLNPTVGTVGIAATPCPNFNLYRMVVFPSKNLKNCSSLLTWAIQPNDDDANVFPPNIFFKALVKPPPISPVALDANYIFQIMETEKLMFWSESEACKSDTFPKKLLEGVRCHFRVNWYPGVTFLQDVNVRLLVKKEKHIYSTKKCHTYSTILPVVLQNTVSEVL